MHLQGMAEKVIYSLLQNTDRRALSNYSYPGEFNKYIPAVYISYFKRKRDSIVLSECSASVHVVLKQ